MHSRGDTVKAMAAQLGRSDLAVRMKLDALGLQQHPVPPPAPAAHAPLPAPVPAALPAPAPAALPAPSTAAAKAPHAGSKRKVEDEEEDEASTGKEQQGAPAPSTPAKKRETTLA
ncbi:hypothetical protein HXX76_015520 [Chlamydomonas incerta]|uniref:Uncharacterized protein n=1 Tax=Chlamydomonas incerta TaxID=51695 RepID=A0A835SM27_CHLIN|nr:hypothetical protein HXX76_015520 [Chlamydomonas incerta]|eukprot:KAG2423135.1 hypothetical protein HXX76_015520 [Chlamydomonas incerta]